MRAGLLLWREAAMAYDQSPHLQRAAREARFRGFGAAAEWMALAMQRPSVDRGYAQRLGVIKYLSCLSVALATGGLTAVFAGWPSVTAVALVVFYLAESQLVFLFPAMIDLPNASLWQAMSNAVRLRVAAGNTLYVVGIVVALAALMLFGGLFGKGFLRSWCAGCLAVARWYERVRGSA